MINWKVRYAALFELYPELSDPGRAILEVGSGAEGVARYLKRSIVGVDRSFGAPTNPNLQPVRASILSLPFVSAAFEDVLCVDTLEHLQRRERARAVRELIRVARSRVIVSGPAGGFAQEGDAAYAEHIARRRRPLPQWLEEHLRHGSPSFGDMLEIFVACGYSFTVHVNEGVIQHYSGLFADNYPFMARFSKLHDGKFSLESPLTRADGDVPYSYLFTVDVRSPCPPIAVEKQSGAATRSASTRKRVALFAVGHRIDRMPSIPGIERILVGPERDVLRPASGILSDDSGESISDRNPDLSEMTAIYWVWKNVTGLDGVGFCHYRRYFDFRQRAAGSARETRLRTPEDVSTHRASFVDRSVIAGLLEQDAIAVTRVTGERLSNAEQYMCAHVPEHYLAMVNYVLARHPWAERQVVSHVSDGGFHGNNMFVMPWFDFERLCRFWFDCLFGLDAKISRRPAGYQRRVLAFLSERIFDIHVRWLRDSGRRVVEYPLFFLEESAFAADD